MSLWNRIVSGMSKSRTALSSGLRTLTGGTGRPSVALDALEASLIQADLGVRVTERLLDGVKRSGQLEEAAVRNQLIVAMTKMLTPVPISHADSGWSDRPRVVLLVGVNGVGKTTTVAKLAARSLDEGKTVLLAACDTFRAAAVEQLRLWGERLGVEVVFQQSGSDPAAVAFDAVSAARARSTDVVYIDSAGRLHTKHSLMDEVAKVKRVISKTMPGAPHEVLLVLDATVGQNGLAQARAFHAALGLTGIVVTKLDGSSKGGIVVAVVDELGVPVKWLGLGETVDALVPFDASAFAHGLVGTSELETAASSGASSS